MTHKFTPVSPNSRDLSISELYRTERQIKKNQLAEKCVGFNKRLKNTNFTSES